VLVFLFYFNDEQFYSCFIDGFRSISNYLLNSSWVRLFYSIFWFDNLDANSDIFNLLAATFETYGEG